MYSFLPFLCDLFSPVKKIFKSETIDLNVYISFMYIFIINNDNNCVCIKTSEWCLNINPILDSYALLLSHRVHQYQRHREISKSTSGFSSCSIIWQYHHRKMNSDTGWLTACVDLTRNCRILKRNKNLNDCPWGIYNLMELIVQ